MTVGSKWQILASLFQSPNQFVKAGNSVTTFTRDIHVSLKVNNKMIEVFPPLLNAIKCDILTIPFCNAL